MATQDIGRAEMQWHTKEGLLRAAAPAILPLAAVALGICVTIARADNTKVERRQQDATVQQAAQLPPPARVVLPAPWETAAPNQPATAPKETINSR